MKPRNVSRPVLCFVLAIAVRCTADPAAASKPAPSLTGLETFALFRNAIIEGRADDARAIAWYPSAELRPYVDASIDFGVATYRLFEAAKKQGLDVSAFENPGTQKSMIFGLLTPLDHFNLNQLKEKASDAEASPVSVVILPIENFPAPVNYLVRMPDGSDRVNVVSRWQPRDIAQLLKDPASHAAWNKSMQEMLPEVARSIAAAAETREEILTGKYTTADDAFTAWVMKTIAKRKAAETAK